MLFLIKISSKDKKNLDLYLKFFFKFENKDLNVKNIANKKCKKFLSILKSPHINKSAQEQFEFKFYNKTLFIQSLYYYELLYFFKKMKSALFPFIKIQIKIIHSGSSIRKQIIKASNPDCFNFQFFKRTKFNQSFLCLKYINLLDLKGELFMKKLCASKNIFSSVG